MKLAKEERTRQKLYWFQEARDLGNIKLACQRLWIRRNTYCKWCRIYMQSGCDKERLTSI